MNNPFTTKDPLLDIINQVVLGEKKLTDAEMKKREEIVLAIKRENPDMEKSKAYAIATAQAMKEEVELDEAATRKEVKKVYSKKGNHIGTVYNVDNGKDKPFISAHYHPGGFMNNSLSLKSHEDAEKWIHHSHSSHLEHAKARHDEAKLELRQHEKHLKSIPEEVELDEAKDPAEVAKTHRKRALSAADRDEQEDYCKHMIKYHTVMKTVEPHNADKHEERIKYHKQSIGESVEQFDEAKKSTHENPLITIHKDGRLHAHLWLSTANDIHKTDVKHTAIHAGPVKVKTKYGDNLEYTLSKHHDSNVKEEVGQVKQRGIKQQMLVSSILTKVQSFLHDNKRSVDPKQFITDLQRKLDTLKSSDMKEEAEQVDEVSTGKKMAVAYRAGKRYVDAKKQDDYLTKIGAHALVAADVSDKKKHINTIKRSGTMGKLASVAGAIKKTYAEEVEQIDEGMDKLDLAHWSKIHRDHTTFGRGSQESADRINKIEAHVKKKYGKDAHTKMVDDSRRYASGTSYGAEGKPKKMKEEAEQIDEISKKTLGNYVAKAVVDVHNDARWAGETDDKDAKNRAFKRLLGVKSAASRLSQQVVPGGRISNFRREDVEQIDEVAKKKLTNGTKAHHPEHGTVTVGPVGHGGGSNPSPRGFVQVTTKDGKKKSVNVRHLTIKEEVEQIAEGPAGMAIAKQQQKLDDKSKKPVKTNWKLADRLYASSAKRKTPGRTPHERALLGDSVAMEEVESLDELSKKTLGSYISKSSLDAAVHADAHAKATAKNDETDRNLNRNDMTRAEKEKVRKVMHADTSKPWHKARKRLLGIDKAVGKLTKEEVELNLDEQLENFWEAYTTMFNEAEDQQQNILLRAMAKDPTDLMKMKRAIKMGDKALTNPALRQEILTMLDKMMHLTTGDPSLLQRTKMGFQKAKKLPEEVEQIDELSKGLMYRYFKKADKGGSEKRYAGMKLAAQKTIPLKSSVKIQGTGELDPAKEDKRMRKEEVELEEGFTHYRYSGHVNGKDYEVHIPRKHDLGDYSDHQLHRKISRENPHLHHHEVTAIVHSGGEEDSHVEVEHKGQKHKHHVYNEQEPDYIYEEVEKAPFEGGREVKSSKSAASRVKKIAKGMQKRFTEKK